MLIKNYEDIATNPLRKDVLDIVEFGLAKVQPYELVKSQVLYDKTFNSVIVQNKSYDLIRGRIFVVGGGKAVGFMAKALEEIIGPDNITAGIVNCTESNYLTEKIKINKASHPLPDKRGVKGIEEMLQLKKKYNIGPKDLVIFLISGGGSSLLPSPVDAIKLKDKQTVTQMLLESGADIREINTVRKHLSKVKGGKMAEFFAPAKVVSLILSDVVSDDASVIASGISASDPTTFKDASDVLVRYNLLEKIPPCVKIFIERGCAGQEEETPKYLNNVFNHLIGNNILALEAMAVHARSLGHKPLIIDYNLTGDTAETAIQKSEEIIAGDFNEYDLLIAGGETVPALPKDYGRGGRNQHFAAVTMLMLKDRKTDWAMASLASDGIDYCTDASGAIIDHKSFPLADKYRLNIESYIHQFDTNSLFKKMDDSIIEMGDTGTNVGDIVVYLLK